MQTTRRAGRARGPASGPATVVLGIIALLFLPRLGQAHTLGVSTAQLEVAPDGRVHARLVFASAEPLRGTPLRDDDLRAFVLDGVDVAADDTRCEPTYEGSTLGETDGLELDASFACPPGAGEIALTLYYLGALPAGHRELARIEGPPGSGAAVESVLRADRRGLALKLPGATVPRRPGRALVAALLVAGAILVAGAGLALRRRRLRAS